MGFVEAIKACLGKYASFKGRALRSEYWFFVLFTSLVMWLLVIIGLGILSVSPTIAMVFNLVIVLFGLLMFLPAISVTVRRLHDGGRSGWWYWIVLVPVIGSFVFLYWMIKKGQDGENTFGPYPLVAAAELESTTTEIPAP